MPVEQADQATKIAVSDILSVFSHQYGWREGPLVAHRDKVYEFMKAPIVDASRLHGELSGSDEIGWRDQSRFLQLEPIRARKTFLPLVTLHSENAWAIFRIYALLTLVDDDSSLKSLAIRFETDEDGQNPEGDPGKHDYCHAQLCQTIGPSAKASTPAWLPDYLPAIPLDADNQVSLILCMLTALYGGSCVYDKLSSSGHRNVRKYLKEVRALHSIMKKRAQREKESTCTCG